MAKLNLSGDWKSLMLAHIEKVVLGGVGLALVMLIWSATNSNGVEPTKRPDDLEAFVKKSNDHMLAPVDPKSVEDWPVHKGLGNVSIMNELSAEPYETKKSMDPLLFERKPKRLDPELFAATNLEVQAGYGSFAVSASESDAKAATTTAAPASRPGFNPGMMRGMSPPGGKRDLSPEQLRNLKGKGKGKLDPKDLKALEDLVESRDQAGQARRFSEPGSLGGVAVGPNQKAKGVRWVVVNACVPYEKQVQEFVDKFGTAQGYDPNYDLPVYVGYYIDRAVVSGTNSGELEWKQLMTVHPDAIERATDKAKWATTVPDIVDPTYLHERLVFPLGPLVLRNWDQTVTHSQIPLAAASQELEKQRLKQIAEEKKNRPAEEEQTADPFSMQASPANTPAFGKKPFGEQELASLMQSKMSAAEKPVKYLLVRFFDFDVKPGESYQYRIRLVMRDPNYSRPKQPIPINGKGKWEVQDPAQDDDRIAQAFLHDSVVQRLTKDGVGGSGYRYTAWSEPSPVVQIPKASTVLAGIPKKMPPRAYAEPLATVLVEQYDFDKGINAYAERENVARGTVFNFIQTIDALDPEKRSFTSVPDYEFKTDMVLLDLRGGEGLTERDPNLISPSEMLLMDSNGKFYVRNELEDFEQYEQWRKFHKAPPVEKRKEKEDDDRVGPRKFDGKKIEQLMGTKNRRSRPTNRSR